VFRVSLQTSSEIFLILRRNERDVIRSVHRSSCKVPCIQILMKLDFSGQIFEKKQSNVKFHENLSSESRDVPCGQTDMKKLIVTFHKFTNAPKKQHNIDFVIL
jgi:hypothetical protein